MVQSGQGGSDEGHVQSRALQISSVYTGNQTVVVQKAVVFAPQCYVILKEFFAGFAQFVHRFNPVVAVVFADNVEMTVQQNAEILARYFYVGIVRVVVADDYPLSFRRK